MYFSDGRGLLEMCFFLLIGHVEKMGLFFFFFFLSETSVIEHDYLPVCSTPDKNGVTRIIEG